MLSRRIFLLGAVSTAAVAAVVPVLSFDRVSVPSDDLRLLLEARLRNVERTIKSQLEQKLWGDSSYGGPVEVERFGLAGLLTDTELSDDAVLGKVGGIDRTPQYAWRQVSYGMSFQS